MNVQITDEFVARPLDTGTVLLFRNGEPIVSSDGAWARYRSVADAAIVALTYPFKSLLDMSDAELARGVRLALAYDEMGIQKIEPV